jgi:DNA invertase Pin-like site-specific DNA recombinase
MKKRAIILVRISTEQQDSKEQKQQLLQKAVRDGYNEDEIESIENVESGIKLSDEERNGLNTMYDTINNPDNEIQAVYCWELSRLSRNDLTLMKLKNYFIENEIQFICLNPNLTLLDNDRKLNNDADLLFNLFISLCKTEMIVKKERFRRTRIRYAREERYIGGFIKYGYYIENSKYKIDEDKAKLIRLIFDLYETGLSEIGVTRELRERGYIDIKYNKVRKILNSIEYTGKGNKGGLERNYPIIISKEQYQRCREVANKNNSNINKTRSVYYAYKLIKCTCGSYWIGNKSSVAYMCYANYSGENEVSKIKGDKCDNHSTININVIDSLLWSITPTLEAAYLTEEAEKDIDRLSEEIDLYQTKIDGLNPHQIKINILKERNKDLYLDGEISQDKYDINKFKYKEQETELNNNKVKWQNEINRISELIDNIKSVNRLWDDVDISNSFDEKLTILRNITDDNIRFNLIHKHIKEVRISDYIKGKTKQIDIELMNGVIKTYYYDYRTGKRTIWFIHPEYNDEAVLMYEYLNRFERKRG